MRIARLLLVATAVVLAVAAVLIGPALFLAIPWPVRWWMGEGSFVGLVALAYAWALRSTPPRPWPLLDPRQTPSKGLHRALAIVLQVVTASFAIPLLDRPGNGGLYDWDLYLSWFEVVRISLLRFHEFPWWNPYVCGGFPLAAEPQVGLASIDLPLSLAFGPSVGIRLASVASMMLAVEGARRLARLWLADPWAVALAAAVYGWNGSIVLLGAIGHALTLCHPLLPWLLVFAFRLDRGMRYAVGLGMVSAIGVLAVIQYPTAYGALIAAGVLIWGFLAQPKGERVRYAALVALAAGVFLALAGWRLALSGLVLRDFPRKLTSAVDDTPWGLLHAMLDRLVPRRPVDFVRPGWDAEGAAYVGWVPLLAAAWSLRGPWRWWHTLAFAGFALALGAVQVYQPSYWLSSWPGFSTMHMVARWKLPAYLGLGLAAGAGIRALRQAGGFGARAGAGLVVFALGDLGLYAHQCLLIAFDLPPAGRLEPGPPVEPIVNLRRCEDGLVIQNYEAIRRGYGVVQAYCPLLGYDRHGRKTARLWRGHPDYRGEFVSEGRPVAPASWGPNRIAFRLGPGQEVELNQNPSSYWLGNGRRLFPDAKVAELQGRFVARADGRGILVLEARPPDGALALAGGLTAAGVALAAAGIATGRRRGPDPGREARG